MTTSGLFFKVPGRVGDSPLPGCGCYCDNDVGAAGSTGRGEAVIKTVEHKKGYLVAVSRSGEISVMNEHGRERERNNFV